MPTTTPVSHPEPSNNAPSRRRKVKAVIAAGTVLGVGAMATLATWNDSEFAQGLFGAGSYSVVSSDDGVDFQDHPQGTPAELKFSAPNAVPDQQFAASFWLRTDGSSSYAGEISGIDVASAGGDQPENFRNVRVSQVIDGECEPGATTGPQLAEGDDLTTLAMVDDAPTTILPRGEGTTPGDAVELCFQVTAAGEDDLQPGEDASATWQVLTQSEVQD